MPYYRITIFLKHRRPSQGIKFYDNSNIDSVTTIARVKAQEYFGDRNVIEVEAAMLSNHCRAVKLYQEKRYIKGKAGYVGRL